MCLLFFINHFAYLSVETFDYSYNMHVNIFTGKIGISSDFRSYDNLLTFLRRTWWTRMDNLVPITSKETTICMEMHSICAFSRSSNGIGVKRFSTNYVDFWLTCIVASEHGAYHNILLQVSTQMKSKILD